MAYKKRETGLISNAVPDSTISEQYRSIRTTIDFLSKDDNNQVFMITSPGFGEGRSTITTNLAASFVQKGEKVLVVDADLRKPTLHLTFKQDNTSGLTDILKGETTISEAVKTTEIVGLDLVTSGTAVNNPSELLSKNTLEEFMEVARLLYNIVLVDSSPILDVTDARIIANKCDGVILVLCNGKTKKEEAIEAKRIMELVRAEFIGVIINKKST